MAGPALTALSPAWPLLVPLFTSFSLGIFTRGHSFSLGTFSKGHLPQQTLDCLLGIEAIGLLTPKIGVISPSTVTAAIYVLSERYHS